MGIVGSDALAQGRKTRVRRVAVLLLDDDARGLAPHDLGRRQVGLAQAEVDAPRPRAVEDLPDHALLYAAQPPRRLELAQSRIPQRGVLGFGFRVLGRTVCYPAPKTQHPTPILNAGSPPTAPRGRSSRRGT